MPCMLTVYGMADSGNCYKVKLALEQLALPYRWVEVDSTQGGTRTAEFLARNPNGKVPTLQLEDGSHLPESNAILYYLAEGTPLLPADKVGRARALQWMFFEQYSHEPYIAVARFILRYLPADAPRRSELPRPQERGRQALAVMEQHLSTAPYFAGARYSVADIALYAYTHADDDGGFRLGDFPAVKDWIARVASQPRHVAPG
ncbi:MAG: glutathione S-transferase family protein [Proteobacteria bacterium]|nr:glutathione S-transferase family protein [Pseudomonadota bacterium]